MKKIWILILAVLIPMGMMEVRETKVDLSWLDSVPVVSLTIPVLAVPESLAAYTYNTLMAASDVSAATENTYSTRVLIMGKFNLSISGTWAGTATVQRSWDLGTTWVNVATFTSNVEQVGFEPEENVYYRIGIVTGDYTSGTMKGRLSRQRKIIY